MLLTYAVPQYQCESHFRADTPRSTPAGEPADPALPVHCMCYCTRLLVQQNGSTPVYVHACLPPGAEASTQGLLPVPNMPEHDDIAGKPGWLDSHCVPNCIACDWSVSVSGLGGTRGLARWGRQL
ncbi:unnamed protein product [Natator depressus]